MNNSEQPALLAGRQIDLEINHDWQIELAKEAVDYADSLLSALEQSKDKGI